jgi:hypothetical protein
MASQRQASNTGRNLCAEYMGGLFYELGLVVNEPEREEVI